MTQLEQEWEKEYWEKWGFRLNDMQVGMGTDLHVFIRKSIIDMLKMDIERHRLVVRRDRQAFRDYFLKKKRESDNGNSWVGGWNDAIDEVARVVSEIIDEQSSQ